MMLARHATDQVLRKPPRLRATAICVRAWRSSVWEHMGNSQSARRFPTLEDARARDPCQEGQQNYLRSAVSRLRQIQPSLKAQEPCRKFFSGGNRLEESRT